MVGLSRFGLRRITVIGVGMLLLFWSWARMLLGVGLLGGVMVIVVGVMASCLMVVIARVALSVLGGGIGFLRLLRRIPGVCLRRNPLLIISW